MWFPAGLGAPPAREPEECSRRRVVRSECEELAMDGEAFSPTIRVEIFQRSQVENDRLT